MGKVALFLATGFEEIEAVCIIDVMRRAGVELDIISVSGVEYVTGGHGIILKSDYLFFFIDFSVYDLFILPGGMPGTTNLSKHEGLCQLLVDVNEQSKRIAAICAAPIVLGQIGVLKGRMATCYPGFEEGLTDAKVLNQDIVRDGNIITGKGAGIAMDFALELLKDYLTMDEVKLLAERLILKSKN